MTVRKADIRLAPRLTAYLTHEEVAGELRLSPPTIGEMVDRGLLPKPYLLGPNKNLPRWCWAEVDEAIRKNNSLHLDQEAYFRERTDGAQKDRKREIA
jgi:predicted DNA-binding transcriptional regulator AlpA